MMSGADLPDRFPTLRALPIKPGMSVDPAVRVDAAPSLLEQLEAWL
jgi:hypothetical protein